MEQPEKDNPLETIVAVLIAVVTVIGAVAAWRASVAADAAGDADFAGLKATLNAEQTRALTTVNAYEHYGSFTAYSRYNELGNAIGEDLQKGTELTDEQTLLLERQQAEVYDLAQANQDLFSHRFLSRDGSYSVQRELGEAWADTAKEKDLNPDPQYADADRFRAKTNLLLGSVSVLAVALVFYTLVEAAGERWQYGMVALGTIFMIAGTAAAVYIEFMR
ncbi:MAG: hypothetical protein HY260_06175 [Chloroflexi bacterium]|nr:hypothetical protein [Chloroflexota bacterium]